MTLADVIDYKTVCRNIKTTLKRNYSDEYSGVYFLHELSPGYITVIMMHKEEDKPISEIIVKLAGCWRIESLHPVQCKGFIRKSDGRWIRNQLTFVCCDPKREVSAFETEFDVRKQFTTTYLKDFDDAHVNGYWASLTQMSKSST